MDARNVVPIWIYPQIEDGDVYEKTLDSAGVTVNNSDEVQWNTAGVNTEPVGLAQDENSGDMRGSKFMYAEAFYNASMQPSEFATIDYEFTDLPKGEYQVNLSVPSDLTINRNGYEVCNIAYVKLAINGGAPFDAIVDMSRDAYSGEWIYVTSDILDLTDTSNTV